MDDFSSTEIRMIQLVFPDDLNHYGSLFGGRALSWMDMAAFLSAVRYCRKKVTTASSNRVDFKMPVKSGHAVELIAKVIKVGRTSMTVQVHMWGEDLMTGERYLCTTGDFVMVALDDEGNPTPAKAHSG